MDRETTKELLSAYRPNGADAMDGKLRDALAFTERDPETRNWFEGQSRFDRKAAEAMKTIPVPSDGKEQLLAKIEWESDSVPGRPRVFRWFHAVGIGMAAALVLGLFLTHILPLRNSNDAAALLRAKSFSLSTLVDEAFPLDYRSGNLREMRGWLAANGVEMPAEFPEGLDQNLVLGCRIFSKEEGSSVSLLCFDVSGKQAHLLVFEGGTRQLLENLPQGWFEEDGWNLRKAGNTDEHSFVLASRADPKVLDRLLM